MYNLLRYSISLLISKVTKAHFLGLLPFLLLLIAYSNTLYSPPILDDFHSFITEKQVYISNWSIDTLISLSMTKFGWSRLIPMATFSWDHWWGQGSIYVFHLTNILIHFTCLIALYWMTYQLSQADQAQNAKNPDAPTISSCALAIWVMAIWGLHPAQTNAVTYLVQRMASLVTLFCVLSVASYVSARRIHLRDGIKLKPLLLYMVTSLFAVFSFLSKENSIMLPMVLVCTEVWFFQPESLGSLLGKFRFRHWVALTCIGLIVLVFVLHSWPKVVSSYQDRHFTLFERLLTETRVVVWYMSILLWPAPGRLSMEHDVELSTSFLQPYTTAFSIIVLAGILWTALRWRRKYRLATYGMMWFFLHLLLESSVVPLELVFEHRMYLPSAGFALTLVSIGYLLSRRLCAALPHGLLQRAAWCSFCVIIAALTLATFFRNETWRTPISIHEDSVAKAPKNPRAHVNLAIAYFNTERYHEAITEAEKTLELGRKNFEEDVLATNTLVSAWSSLNQKERAIEEGERLLSNSTSDIKANNLPMLYRNIAMTYLGIGKPERGFPYLQRALEYAIMRSDAMLIPYLRLEMPLFLRDVASQNIDIDGDGDPDPGGLDVNTWVARKFLTLGDRKNAAQLLESAKDEPSQDGSAIGLLAEVRSKEEADHLQVMKGTLENKYVRKPFSPFNASMAIAFLTKKVGLFSPLSGFGEKMLDYALSLHPDSSDAHLLKGWYYYNRNESKEAVAAARRAIELDPEYARAWVGLGFFLAQTDLKDEAIEALGKSLDLYPGCPERKEIQAFSHALAVAEADKYRTTQSDDRPESLELGAGVHPAMPTSAPMSPPQG